MNAGFRSFVDRGTPHNLVLFRCGALLAKRERGACDSRNDSLALSTVSTAPAMVASSSTGRYTNAKRSLHHDYSSYKLQQNTQHKCDPIVPAPAANESNEHWAERSDGSADRIRQAHNDRKGFRFELAMDYQRRQRDQVPD